MLILYFCEVDTISDGSMIFKAIISTALLAFISGGASVVWQEEKIGMGAAVLIHGTSLYISYLAMYLINGWLGKDYLSLLIFSLIFIGTYVLIWLIIYLIEKNRAKNINKKLKLNN